MDDKPSNTDLMIYTIGHSNHPLEIFLNLLSRYQIEVMADVRSSPYSSAYISHFNKETIAHSIRTKGIKYLFLGDMVGGQPRDEEFYDGDGYVLYGRLAESTEFQNGIARIISGIERYRVALLCAEEDPTKCHRRLLIGRVLREDGVNVLHIRGDGRVQTEEEVALEEEFRRTKGQTSLFDMKESDV